jgi:NitT/TauT family transport system ATP-binding protein
MSTASPAEVGPPVAGGPVSSARSAAGRPSGPSRTKIAITGVTRRFHVAGDVVVEALGPIDLEIAEGEFVCLVGPSGCGKSTLLRSIAGLTAPSTGQIDLEVDLDGRSPLAMVFQDYGIYPWKTVESNVRFGLQLAGVPRAEARARARVWLERLRLSDFAKAYPHTLSGGMRQRVAIARALAVEPQILLMDEPFAALDAQLREVLQDELLALWQADRRTVVFVTHSLEEALVLGDRVVVMSNRPGRIVESYRVPFERPRSGALRNDPAFGAARAHLWQLLREEIDVPGERRSGEEVGDGPGRDGWRRGEGA